MKKTRLTDLERFNIIDSGKGLVYKGFDQDWYGFWWRRLAGCGPTTVSNMLLYEFGRGGAPAPVAAHAASALASGVGPMAADGGAPAPVAAQAASALASGVGPAAADGGAPDAASAKTPGAAPAPDALGRDEATAFMNRVWRHVTPGKGGVNTTGKLVKGIESYAREAGLTPDIASLDVPEAMASRPRLDEAACFIEECLERGSPVAFLNLDNGTEKQLDKWHWVTIIGIEYEEPISEADIDVLDNCNIINLSLSRWLKTSTRGGGFVKFGLAPAAPAASEAGVSGSSPL